MPDSQALFSQIFERRMMITIKRALGDRGEKAAARYLKRNRYKIVEKNYVSGKNEIDLIVENKDFLIFVEVKSRTYIEDNQTKFGRACLAVDPHKRRCILSAARIYCAEHHTKKRIRFDIVEVYFSKENQKRILSIHHMPDAFRTE